MERDRGLIAEKKGFELIYKTRSRFKSHTANFLNFEFSKFFRITAFCAGVLPPNYKIRFFMIKCRQKLDEFQNDIPVKMVQ